VTPLHPEAPAFALFDVDGTLTRGDTFIPFLRRVAGSRVVASAFGRVIIATLTGITGSRQDVKEMLTATLSGRTATEVETAGREHAQWIFQHYLRRSIAKRLAEHRAHGSLVILVSASLRPYIAPLGELLGAHDVVCTDLEMRDSTVTGRLSGVNCRGREKVTQVAKRFGDIWPQSVAYGNGKGDRAMLEAAAVGYRVGPMGTIRLVATQPALGEAGEAH